MSPSVNLLKVGRQLLKGDSRLGTPATSSSALRVVREKATAPTANLRVKTNFSSSSNTGCTSVPEAHVSAAGSKRSFSHNCGLHGQNNGSLSNKSRPSPPASREKAPLSTLSKNQPSPANTRQNYGASLASRSNSGSNKGSDSSQVTRRSGKSISCGHNCSTKPENPERYLTPLQQKEVTIRHLKKKLKESECKVTEREREIEKLKAQVERMKEDWIEDECNHVEMELSLLEARREIKELKQVIESMKNSLAEKDKKFQKYFLEISIENKKMESLVSSMEMALKSSVRDEQRPEYTCDSEGKPLCTTMPDSPTTEDQALEELADSGLFLHEDTANGTDLFEESLTTTTPELSEPAPSNSTVNQEMLENVLDEKLTFSQEEEEKVRNMMVEQTIHTDVVPYSLEGEQFIQNMFRAQSSRCLSSKPAFFTEGIGSISLESLSDSGIVVDLTPGEPNSTILLSPVTPPCRKVEHGVNENHFVEELDFTEPHDDEVFGYVNTVSQTGIKKRYWSSRLASDLAVAAPVVPTIMQPFSTHGAGTDLIYSTRALFCSSVLVHRFALDYLICPINRFENMLLVSEWKR
ncbi:syntabulin-like [Phalacrocorax aristotelis]|uniref:syntabulin-like n=1 Tax=Phalacrocorax aristotelis TaxID=126867 RepID=UPI003F4BC9F4